jgi:hypothetical protein
MTSSGKALLAACLLSTGCDPVSVLEGHVRTPADSSASRDEKGVIDAAVSVHCPDGHTDSRWVRTDQDGHFLHAMVSFDPFDDNCVIHVERDGFDPADISVRSAKVAEGPGPRRIRVLIRLKQRGAPR